MQAPFTDRYAGHVAALVSTLRTLVAGRPVALLDWPHYANAGDHFIWLGQKYMIRHELGCDVLYECPIRNVDFLKLRALPDDAVLIASGGGNFGDLYAPHQQFRLAITAAHLNRRIVFMPQTVMFAHKGRRDDTARVLSLHSDLHVMARDRRSLNRLKRAAPAAGRHLHIDAAFALQPVVDAIMAHLDIAPTRQTLHLLRHDKEAGEQMPARAAAADWARPDDLAGLAATAPKPATLDFTRGIFTSPFDEKSWPFLWAAVRLFAGAKTIVTDRLHGHILALMMGKKHVVLDNSYGKNSHFVATWSDDDPLVGKGWKTDHLSAKA